MKKILILLLLIMGTTLISGCSGNSDIKDNFCGIHIDYRYCKCAFHNEHCNSIGMSKSEAKELVYSQYEAWIGEPSEESEDEKYGIIEKNGNLYLNSKPGEVLSIKTEDLPAWAQEQIATVGASIAVAGPPDTITTGDNNVLLDGRPIARVGDSTAHGGEIINGSNTIFVNNKPVAIIGGFAIDPTISPGPVPSVGGPIVSN
jgi:uncharacterized Zn-binding protein involved in type VI secretion